MVLIMRIQRKNFNFTNCTNNHTMANKEPGYVYILTNPSFREDWVKIGKSSRPVDIRSKELDNTAVPLPFEIYATLQTVKYDVVEKKIHKASAFARTVNSSILNPNLPWKSSRTRQ